MGVDRWFVSGGGPRFGHLDFEKQEACNSLQPDLQITGSTARSAIPRQSTASLFSRSGVQHVVNYHARREGSFVIAGADGPTRAVIHSWTPDSIDVAIGVRRVRATFTHVDSSLVVNDGAGDIELTVVPRFTPPGAAAQRGGLNAPMPGRIIDVRVAAGDPVTSGQLLMVMEAMKMEHRITAADGGVVTEVLVRIGDQVKRGAPLLVVAGEP